MRIDVTFCLQPSKRTWKVSMNGALKMYCTVLEIDGPNTRTGKCSGELQRDKTIVPIPTCLSK